MPINKINAIFCSLIVHRTIAAYLHGKLSISVEQVRRKDSLLKHARRYEFNCYSCSFPEFKLNELRSNT
jgi:hypothetical protein